MCFFQHSFNQQAFSAKDEADGRPNLMLERKKKNSCGCEATIPHLVGMAAASHTCVCTRAHTDTQSAHQHTNTHTHTAHLALPDVRQREYSRNQTQWSFSAFHRKQENHTTMVLIQVNSAHGCKDAAFTPEGGVDTNVLTKRRGGWKKSS